MMLPPQTTAMRRPSSPMQLSSVVLLVAIHSVLLIQPTQGFFVFRTPRHHGRESGPDGFPPKSLFGRSRWRHNQQPPPAPQSPEWTPLLPGTTTQLANVVSTSTFGGDTVEFIQGRSKAKVYRAKSEKALGGVGIVKVWCLPDEFDLLDESKRKYCSLDNARETIQRMMALQRVTDECGLDDLAPRMWEETISAEIPDKGYVVERRGLLQDIAPGVSLWGFTNSARPELVNRIVSKINSTQVVRGAIYDLLFTMCDRHLGNIFVDKDSNIKLIDNDQAFGMSDEKHEMCSLSSAFLPTTQCHAIAASGKDYAKKRKTWRGPEASNPGVTLDYRCHAPGGKIGRDYPPSVSKCLKKISNMRADAIRREYGFGTIVAAYHLKMRAWAMHHLGFEFALYHGAPQNPECDTFPKAQPCCRMAVATNSTGQHILKCSDPPDWMPPSEVPELCKDPVVLGEDISYTGKHESCRACNFFANGWQMDDPTQREPQFPHRIPDHTWEEWEDGQQQTR